MDAHENVRTVHTHTNTKARVQHVHCTHTHTHRSKRRHASDESLLCVCGCACVCVCDNSGAASVEDRRQYQTTTTSVKRVKLWKMYIYVPKCTTCSTRSQSYFGYGAERWWMERQREWWHSVYFIYQNDFNRLCVALGRMFRAYGVAWRSMVWRVATGKASFIQA